MTKNKKRKDIFTIDDLRRAKQFMEKEHQDKWQKVDVMMGGKKILNQPAVYKEHIDDSPIMTRNALLKFLTHPY